LYDLCTEESDRDEKDAGANVQKDSDDRADEHPDALGEDGSVKVLSEKTGPVDNFREEGMDS
jgi:hypothetical protein